jgi:hypothetical protein
MSAVCRYCCKSRKSNNPKNLAKVDLGTSLLTADVNAALLPLALRNLGSRERPLVRRQQAHLDGLLLGHFLAHRGIKGLTRREQLGDRGTRRQDGPNKLQGRQPSLRLKYQQRYNRFSWRDPRSPPPQQQPAPLPVPFESRRVALRGGPREHRRRVCQSAAPAL